MNTQNIISTPNIDGNVSSCETKIATIDCATRSNFFVCNNVSYATNNCTNQQQVYNSCSSSGDGVFISVFVIPSFLFMIIIAIVGSIVVAEDWFDKLKIRKDKRLNQ